MNRKLIAVIAGCAALVVVGIVVGQGVSSANSGAIFTTDESGTIVNQNLYPAKRTVFLDGGPNNGKCTAAGLPDGDYYFQVTDPSGKTLLSSDVIDQRKFTVSSGVISAYLGTSHKTGVGPCQGKTVGLAPFKDTTNSGGEYKVWVTAVANYAPDQGKFGFSAKDSKTDNFKVTGTEPEFATVSGLVYEDMNANGTDDGEPAFPNMVVQVKTPGTTTVVATTTSGPDGAYAFDSLSGGSYDLCEVMSWNQYLDWTPTEPAVSGCTTINAVAGQSVTQNFGNKPDKKPQPD